MADRMTIRWKLLLLFASAVLALILFVSLWTRASVSSPLLHLRSSTPDTEVLDLHLPNSLPTARIDDSETVTDDENIQVLQQSKETSSKHLKDGLLPTDPRAKCCQDISGMALEDVCKTYGSTEPKKELVTRTDGCTCLDYLYCRLVVVTAISSNHFNEAEDMIASVQSNLPNTRIVLFDLGLSDSHRKSISEKCNVDIHKFDFNKYSNVSTVKNLQIYAWKSLIVKEISQDYEVILYGDSSVRILRPVTELLLSYLLDFPYVSGPVSGQPVVSLTHDGMVAYLKLNQTREQLYIDMKQTYQGGVFCMWMTKVFQEKFLSNWVDCASHQECISPTGASLFGCNLNNINLPGYKGEYVGCHRFDQSALNLILYREFGVENWKNRSPLKLSQGPTQMWIVERAATHHYQIKSCP